MSSPNNERGGVGGLRGRRFRRRRSQDGSSPGKKSRPVGGLLRAPTAAAPSFKTKQKDETTVPRSNKTKKQVVPHSPRATDDLPDLAKERDPLPITTFSPKTHSFLATRKTHDPILVIATESAHSLAWKNRLRLTDLLGGLAHLQGDFKAIFPTHLQVPTLQNWSVLGVSTFGLCEKWKNYEVVHVRSC